MKNVVNTKVIYLEAEYDGSERMETVQDIDHFESLPYTVSEEPIG